MAALYVQRPSFDRFTVDQVARPVLIVRVFLDSLAMHDSFSNLLHADAPANALIDGVSGELELPGLDLPADLIYKRHAELAVFLRPSSSFAIDQCIESSSETRAGPFSSSVGNIVLLCEEL